MHSNRGACGNAVYNLLVTVGSVAAGLHTTALGVHKPGFIPTLLNSFLTQFCTLLFDFRICFAGFIHPFHTPYNNHTFFKETNL